MSYNASVSGSKVRVSHAKSGNTKIVFTVVGTPTHAIASGDSVSVFFPKGGVRVYSLSGSLISFSGDCGDVSKPPSKPSAPKVAHTSSAQTRSWREEHPNVEVPDLTATSFGRWLKSVFDFLAKAMVLFMVVYALIKLGPAIWTVMTK